MYVPKSRNGILQINPRNQVSSIMYVKTPSYIPYILSDYQWSIPTTEPEVFLTFDDGPNPEITPFVLDMLSAYGAKASFFVVGNNVLKEPTLTKEIISQGHTIGNHTFSHLNGWKNSSETYWQEIEQTDHIIQEVLGYRPRYFRPPYGRINFFTSRKILKHHKVIMWDVLARDFDASLTPQQCINNVIKNYRFGSTIVLHDSTKCASKIKIILPEILSYFKQAQVKLSPIRC